MKIIRPTHLLITIISLLLLINSCRTVPVTGRSQLSLISNSELLQMSYDQYRDFIQTNKISNDKKMTNTVRKVGKNIQVAVEKFMNQNNLASELQGYSWEFNLVASEEANAWCMPGGKVVVYEGILPYTKTETGLAVVMGHEIAHAIAAHGSERMSQGLLQQLGGVALSVALKDEPEETQALWLTAYGLGTTVGIMLPYSRSHESEADHLGLIFMAMAGYNPREAPKFWQRFSQAGGGQPPEFLSTHPSHETRIKDLNAWMPEALKYYKK